VDFGLALDLPPPGASTVGANAAGSKNPGSDGLLRLACDDDEIVCACIESICPPAMMVGKIGLAGTSPALDSLALFLSLILRLFFLPNHDLDSFSCDLSFSFSFEGPAVAVEVDPEGMGGTGGGADSSTGVETSVRDLDLSEKNAFPAECSGDGCGGDDKTEDAGGGRGLVPSSMTEFRRASGSNLDGGSLVLAKRRGEECEGVMGSAGSLKSESPSSPPSPGGSAGAFRSGDADVETEPESVTDDSTTGSGGDRTPSATRSISAAS
jgi:hypothetical protein